VELYAEARVNIRAQELYSSTVRNVIISSYTSDQFTFLSNLISLYISAVGVMWPLRVRPEYNHVGHLVFEKRFK
jgi:hypothetical protein